MTDRATFEAPSAPQDAASDGTGTCEHTPRWTEWAGILGLAAWPLIWQIRVLWPDMPWGQPAGSDFAALELDTRSVLRGTGVGTWSRLGARNLGPFHAYWSAPWYWLGDQGLGGMIVASWALHGSASVTVVVALARSVGRRAAWLGAAALCVGWLRAGPFAVSDPYNPGYAVPLVLMVVVAGVACVQGRWWFLPVVVGAASACAQAHLAGAPGVAVVVAGVIVLGFRRTRPTVRQVVATMLVAGALWTPTAIDQAIGTGNVSQLVSATARGPDAPDQPFGRPGPSGSRLIRAQKALQMGTLTIPHAAAGGTLVGTASGRPGSPTTPRTFLAIAVLITFVSAAWIGRTRSPAGALIIGLSLAGMAATYLSTASVERGFLTYYLAPIVGYALAALIGFSMVVGRSMSPKHIRAIAAATLVAASLTLAHNGAYGTLSVLTLPAPQPQIRFSELVRQRLPARCHGGTLALEAEFVQVVDLWTVMVELEKRGFATTLPDDLDAALVGHGHRRTGTEVARVAVPTLEELRAGALPPGSVTRLRC